MIQFLPYITKENKQLIRTLADIIKRKEGIQAYIYFKKLITVAMYGTTLEGKISFDAFINYIELHVIKANNSIFTFWYLQNSHNPNGTKEFLFGMNTIIMEKIPLNSIINEMKKVMRNLLKEGDYIIAQEYKQYITL